MTGRWVRHVLWWVVLVILMGCGSTLVGSDEPDDPESLFEAFWASYDRHYAHFQLKGIDWHQVYDEHRDKVGPETTDEELFEIFGEMIAELEDGHVYVVADGRRALSNAHIRSGRSTYNGEVVRENYLRDSSQKLAAGRITYGRIADQFGYLRLSTLSGGDGFAHNAEGWIEEVSVAMEELSDVEAMIIDLRNNGGGRASNSKFVAGHFADARSKFLVTRSRSGPGYDDFSEPRHWYVEPVSEGTFTAPVVVLTNRRTFSAAEWLTLALRQYDHVTHIGSHTGGGLAMFLPRQLANGWMYTISVQDTRCPMGRSYERVGIAPHRYLKNGEDDLDDGHDAMLKEAVDYLKGQLGNHEG